MAVSHTQLLAAIKKNPLVTVCIVIALAAGAGLYYRQGDATAAEQELEDLTRQSRRMGTNIKNAVHLDEDLRAVTTANAEIDQRLVEAGRLAENLQYFYTLEAATGVKLNVRQAAAAPAGRGQPKKKSPFAPLGFSVSLRGTYPQLMDFLQQLEGGRHFCRILTVGISPASGPDDGRRAGRPEELTLTLSLELLGKASS